MSIFRRKQPPAKPANKGRGGNGARPPGPGPAGSAPEPLVDATADAWQPEGAWLNDTHIDEFIAANRIRALVTDRGEIAITDEVTQRQKRSLIMVIRGRFPDFRITFYLLSPINWDELNGSIQEQKKSGSQLEEEQKVANENVNYILQQAVEANASDVYLDIGRKKAKLSFRVYGMVRFVQEMQGDLAAAIARGLFSRHKNRQWEQASVCDCAFDFDHGERQFRVRVNSIPEVRGQSISCRIRDPGLVLPLDEAGYDDGQIELIERICMAPGGIILISGETNSGKSTSATSLMFLARRGQRMIEVADPVEALFDHVTHIELDHYREDADNNFNRLMGAIVRQNPDMLVLGEIRDEATAAAAQRMAIQGKRVLSTIHTQSCVAAIPRLQSLGVHRHLLSLPEFLAGIINQNLVPVVCRSCCHDVHPDIREAAEGTPCAECGGPMIPELQTVNPHLRCRNGCNGTRPFNSAVTSRIQRYRKAFGPDADLRYINPDGCSECTSGITGQTLVAEVYPLGLDRHGAHQLIAEDRLWLLEDHMIEHFGILTKADHARSKVLAGLIDPHVTESIIGEWRPPAGAGGKALKGGMPRTSNLRLLEDDNA